MSNTTILSIIILTATLAGLVDSGWYTNIFCAKEMWAPDSKEEDEKIYKTAKKVLATSFRIFIISIILNIALFFFPEENEIRQLITIIVVVSDVIGTILVFIGKDNLNKLINFEELKKW